MKGARHALTDPVDVLVIGTGAGGAPVLAELARAGLKVVALEAGPRFTARDYTPDEITAATFYWREERLSAGETPQAFGGNNSGFGVGGSMLHYGAFMPRIDARDFHLFSETGQGVDWPFGRDTLLPYMERVEEEIGVSGPMPYPWEPTRRFTDAPPPRNAAAEAMLRGCAALGIRASDGPAALITRARNGRGACVNCGACHQGCRNGAKSGVDNSFLRRAEQDGAEIRPGCFAHGIETNAAGRVTGVVYRHEGVDYRQACGTLILAAGAVETARLLLHTGLANRSGQVGRNYMAHVSTQVWGRLPEETRPNKGYPSLAITEEMMRPADADFVGGYLIQSLGMMPLTWATNVARGRGLWGPDLTRALAGYNHAVGLGAHGDCLPHDGNRVTLSDEPGMASVPKPLISFSYGANERAMHAHAERTLRAILAAAGAEDIWAMPRDAHMIGTCRMGNDPESSVVDPFGRSHDIENLWICDHSVFPSATAANPALAIMALSLRMAENLTARRGRP
ncbi:GMC family oxidoreductase [Acidomonas methanolica]|uniref:Oxidoreductase n=1 Tax=Acidomonas methanolica NBRC 104435 TaxID=1231351 RepID=A0A023D463_ACIMT|nr:GMC family oxidoreductase [Acidomonas methanolica]MBU2653756.1 GMC family oxidoreductase [Acidomonas methanolica]TCS31709.1 hypothetical protein EDC31_102261 [Acidomonas methanolica]GAJ28922.1 oxidoreductase [Acidomonas methanolica NBRC 104435]GEK98126.1 hypothetical protein AME01nite_06250 [Acidomonas methanolica NBRC 104435]